MRGGGGSRRARKPLPSGLSDPVGTATPRLGEVGEALAAPHALAVRIRLSLFQRLSLVPTSPEHSVCFCLLGAPVRGDGCPARGRTEDALFDGPSPCCASPWLCPPAPLPGPPAVSMSLQEARVQPAEFFWTRGAVELAGPQEGALLQQFSVKS